LHLKVPFLLNNGDGGFDVVVDDVAHATPWFSPLFTRKPVVGQVHHVHQGVLGVELPRFLAELVALSEGSLKYFYRVLVAVSESTRRDLVERLGVSADRVWVVPNGVDLGFYRPVCGKFCVPTVLWVGRVKRYKRVDDVLRAFRVVARELPDARLIVVGVGDYLPVLKRLRERLGLSNVVFAGRVSEEEKVRLMGGSWVVVSASFVEGWGLTVTEAAACGTPAVAYGVGGLRDSVVDGVTGLLAEDGNVGDLACKIVRVLTDDGLRKKLSRNALEHAKKFSWDKTAEKFKKILEMAVGGV